MASVADRPPSKEKKKLSATEKQAMLADCRAMVRDMYNHHPEEVDRNELIRTGAGWAAKMRFLLDEHDRLTKLLGKDRSAPEDNAAGE